MRIIFIYSLLFIVQILVCCVCCPADGDFVTESSPEDINIVHVISMNHLDIGFTLPTEIGFWHNVINMYFDQYFPKAIQLAEQTRDLGIEPFKYTTHPWLLSLYIDCPIMLRPKLHCPSSKQILKMTNAIYRGDIIWHAGAMNLQPELLDPSYFEFSLSMSKELIKRFNLTKNSYPRTMSQRDVPGMTRSVIPILKENGINAISVGVNEGSASPAFKPAFIWRDLASGTEIYGLYHYFGYGDFKTVNDCVIISGLSEALCFNFKSDNEGPTNLIEWQDFLIRIKSVFTNAVIQPSSFDSFVDLLPSVRDKLPVYTLESGDTWMQGVASDPYKMQVYREILRARKSCIDSGNIRCELYNDNRDSQFYDFNRILLKIPEHTWGLSGGWITVGTGVNWYNNSHLYPYIQSSFVFHTIIKGWQEQRVPLEYAISSLGNDHPLSIDIKQRLDNLFNDIHIPPNPSLLGFSSVINTSEMIICDYKTSVSSKVHIQFDSNHGYIKHLSTELSSSSWASEDYPLGELIYQTFNATDYDNIQEQYTQSEWSSINKPFKEFSNPIRADHLPYLVNMWQAEDNSCNFILQLNFDEEMWIQYGAPQRVFLSYSPIPLSNNDNEVTNDDNVHKTLAFDLSLRWFSKLPTGFPESIMFGFKTPPRLSYNWWMDKMNNLVSPTEVILNGSQTIHGVIKGFQYTRKNSFDSPGLFIETLDAPLVSPYPYSPLPIPLTPLTKEPTGLASNVYNNIWTTNYLFWYPLTMKESEPGRNARFRYKLILYEEQST